jgi:hypothetical protein
MSFCSNVAISDYQTSANEPVLRAKDTVFRVSTAFLSKNLGKSWQYLFRIPQIAAFLGLACQKKHRNKKVSIKTHINICSIFFRGRA